MEIPYSEAPVSVPSAWTLEFPRLVTFIQEGERSTNEYCFVERRTSLESIQQEVSTCDTYYW